VRCSASRSEAPAQATDPRALGRAEQLAHYGTIGRVLRQRSPILGMAVAVGAVALITGVNYGLRELVPVVSTGVVYLLAVLFVSTAWGLWLGLLTAVLGAAAFNFFHIPPTGKFTIADGENWVALAVFLVAAGVVSGLANAARSRAEEADRRRGEADLAAEMARILLGGAVLEQSLRTVGQRIAAAFGLSSVGVELSWVDSDERRRALPLLVDGSRIGTVLVPREADEAVIEALQDRVIPALETLVGAARKRDELEAQVIETKALRRSNVVKTAVLRSVSHDLRSPLTAITTAAGGLGSDTLSQEGRKELISVIALESARLSRLVDNLLDLSRLQSGGVEPRADWCSLDEVVRAALETVEPPPGGFDIQIHPDLPLLRADAGQLERALANVLDNAARYAGSEPVSIRARATPQGVLLRVGDRGPGIARENLERIFEPFHGSGEHSGSGLGLAIARGFLEANGARIRAESLPGQGTTIVITLPAPAEQPAEVR
jgi:two-component system, OmpR family, sensor histidine kinase KdpD